MSTSRQNSSQNIRAILADEKERNRFREIHRILNSQSTRPISRSSVAALEQKEKLDQANTQASVLTTIDVITEEVEVSEESIKKIPKSNLPKLDEKSSKNLKLPKELFAYLFTYLENDLKAQNALTHSCRATQQLFNPQMSKKLFPALRNSLMKILEIDSKNEHQHFLINNLKIKFRIMSFEKSASRRFSLGHVYFPKNSDKILEISFIQSPKYSLSDGDTSCISDFLAEKCEDEKEGVFEVNLICVVHRKREKLHSAGAPDIAHASIKRLRAEITQDDLKQTIREHVDTSDSLIELTEDSINKFILNLHQQQLSDSVAQRYSNLRC